MYCDTLIALLSGINVDGLPLMPRMNPLNADIHVVSLLIASSVLDLMLSTSS